MKETGILNREIAYAISKMGHMDEMMVIDAGFPIPIGVEAIDLSIAKNKPTVLEVLDELLQHFSVEKIVLSQSTKKTSPTRFDDIANIFDKSVEIDVISHPELKLRSKDVKVIIRTGDYTAFSNVLLISAGGPKWYCEKNE